MNNKILDDVSHYRENILTGEKVLVSPHRSKRPWQGRNEDPVVPARKKYDESCYLCPGNERVSGEKNPQYNDVYVFDNDHPALVKTNEQTHVANNLLKASVEAGVCRVICYSSDHSKTMSELSHAEIKKVIEAWITEYNQLARNNWINHVQIFENKGAIMGCSNPHPHGQIWAQFSIPVEVQKETNKQREYQQKTGSNLLLDYLEQELEEQQRIVMNSDCFVVLVPFWAVWPFETIVIPKTSKQRLSDLNDIEKNDLGQVLINLSQTYDRVFNCNFPYSMGLHQAPCNSEDNSAWQLHFHFYPPLLRSATIKKFMVGYEMMANPQRDVTAEFAAGVLSDCYKKLNKIV